MGAVWLTSLPSWLSSAGLRVTTYKGWETRSRSSGGYDAVLAIGLHHDASSPSMSPASAYAWAWQNSSDRPIGAIYLDRTGLICVGAAGATNTMGKGGPLTCSKGTVPKDQGNKFMLAIEAANNGVGERWPKVQVDAYVLMVKTLCSRLGLKPTDVFGHVDYCKPSCPGRKIDPAGPADGYPNLAGTSGKASWNIGAFRSYMGGSTPTPPDPTPPTPQPPDTGGYAWMASLPTIKKGDSGPYVERMQHLLAAAGFLNAANTANYDGVWGNGTDGAKAKFDSSVGLGGSDTSCGPKSWESLMTGRKW